MIEQKPIKDYEDYIAYSDGRIYSIKNGMFLRQQPNQKGYPIVRLYSEGTGLLKTVHTIIAKAFLLPIRGRRCVCHKDGNKLNNDVSNLEYCVCRRNHSDR